MKKTKMLKKNYEFKNVLTKGKYYSGKYIDAYIKKNKGNGNFLGIAISAIYQYVIGIRKLDTQEKGLVMMVSFITILVICQILPLAFAIVVKFGRG